MKLIDDDGKTYLGVKGAPEWINRDCPDLFDTDGYRVFRVGLFQDRYIIFGSSLEMKELQEVYNFVKRSVAAFKAKYPKIVSSDDYFSDQLEIAYNQALSERLPY